MSPVQSLQHMLNFIARFVPTAPRLAETGIFDEATLEAVMIFQRDGGLPVTGVVSQETWNAITDTYYHTLLHFGPPPPLHVFPDGSNLVEKEAQAPELLIIQAMVAGLAAFISNFEPTELDGINSGGTHTNLKEVQRLSSLEQNGVLNRATWTILSDLYRIYVTRKATSTFHLSV